MALVLLLDGRRTSKLIVVEHIVRNAAWLFSGAMISRTLRAFVLIYAARVLGVDSFGIFSLGISLSAVFTILSDMGVNAVLVREGVKSDESRRRHFSSAFLVKFPLLIFFSILSAVIALFYSLRVPEVLPTIPFIIFIFSFDSLRDLFASLARSLERMDLDAKGQVITNVAIVAFTFVALRYIPSALSMIAGYSAGTLIGLLFTAIPLRGELSGFLKNYSWRLVGEMIRSAWPFGLVSLMGVISVNIDSLIIGILRDVASVGLYSAVVRPIQFLYIIPAAIASAVFPSLAKISENKSEFRQVFRAAVNSGYLFALPLSIGGFITAHGMMSTLYGAEYLPAASSFAVLALTFIFVFPSLFITNALFARNMDSRTFLTYSGIGIFGNIALDIFLINIWGILGSAIATLIIHSVLFLYVSKKLKEDLGVSSYSGISKIIISSLVMGFVALILNASGVNLLITIALSGIIYLSTLILLKEPTLKEISKPIFRKMGIAPEWLGEN